MSELYPRVQVTWHDAWDDTEPHDDLETLLASHGPVTVNSIGFMLRDDKVGIMLAACIDDGGTYKNVLFIPRGMVKGVVHWPAL